MSQIQSMIHEMIAGRLMGETIFGKDNYELGFEDNHFVLYPSKGFFPREEGTYGDTFTGERIPLWQDFSTP